MNVRRAALFVCWTALCVAVCRSQTDCTGVDCPDLQHCIETVLENGACCPTCTKKGCTCEGYQYYDCVQVGFRKGKVPEGKSYFVDFGSTECSCPEGGGKISCQFIQCAEIPPNCIDILQPADGCQECGQIGCTHGNQKYEAGHSFHVDRCQVCHCPNEGGSLMCSLIPGCDLQGVIKPTENNKPLSDTSSLYDGRRMSPEPFPKLALGNTLPLYKQDPPGFGTEDYDSTHAEPTASTIPNLARPLESTTAPLLAHPESSSPSHSAHEVGTHELRDNDEVTHHMSPTTTEAQREASTLLTSAPKVTTANHKTHKTGERTIRHHGDRDRGPEDQADKDHLDHRHNQSSHVGSGRGQERVPVEPPSEQEPVSYPTIQFSPTSRAPVRMKEDREQAQRQPQTLHNYQAKDVKDDGDGTLDI